MRGEPKRVFWELPTIFDYSGIAVITYESHIPGILFYEGLTTITYEATDFMGKTGNCTFTVQVKGMELVLKGNTSCSGRTKHSTT